MIGKCPKCGRFCGDITAHLNRDGAIRFVIGVCKKHGAVDLTDQDWCYEDFFPGVEA